MGGRGRVCHFLPVFRASPEIQEENGKGFLSSSALSVGSVTTAAEGKKAIFASSPSPFVN